MAPLSAPSSTLRFALVLAVATTAVRCGGVAFTVGDESDSSVGTPDTGDGEGAAADGADGSSPATDAWTSEAGDGRDARAADAHGDAPSDASSDQKAATDAPADAIHDAAIDIAACAAICTGCCDPTGHCQAGNTATLCGLKGALCADCSGRNCGLPSNFGCCTTAGACGCAVGGIVGCN